MLGNSLYFAIAAASFAYVFLKAFQQRSVVDNNYLTIVPVSLGMTTMEIFVIAQVAIEGWDWGIVVSRGFSAGIGALAAMHLHNRIYRKRPNVQS